MNTRALPDASGHFEKFGGMFVPEALYAALAQLQEAFNEAIHDAAFAAELGKLHTEYVGRPAR